MKKSFYSLKNEKLRLKNQILENNIEIERLRLSNIEMKVRIKEINLTSINSKSLEALQKFHKQRTQKSGNK